MAWIIGLVEHEELKKLRKLGWKDEDPPAEFKSEDYGLYTTRAFFVDSNVFQIMTGTDWEKEKENTEDNDLCNRCAKNGSLACGNDTETYLCFE
jgi:hypothetical protein